MASVMDDAPYPGDLRDNLEFELSMLQGDLKGLGYDMEHISDFLKETHALSTEVQIQKLQKQIGRMKDLKDKIHSKSTSALNNNNGGGNFAGKSVVKKRVRLPSAQRNSGPSGGEGASDAASDAKAHVKKWRSSDSSGEKQRDFQVKQHGIYVCLSNVQAQTCKNAVLIAEFLFEQLKLERTMPSRPRISETWLQSLPYTDRVPQMDVQQYIRNGYLSSKNLLLAAQRDNRELIRIGGNLPHRRKNLKSRAGAAPLFGGEAGMDADTGTCKDDADGADEDGPWTPRGGAAHAAAETPRPAAAHRRCRAATAGGAAAADGENDSEDGKSGHGENDSEDGEAADGARPPPRSGNSGKTPATIGRQIHQQGRSRRCRRRCRHRRRRHCGWGRRRRRRRR